MKRVLAAALVLTGLVVAPAPASAAGYDGICTGPDALSGTTIVVDFNELDGNGGVAAPTITRCSPNASPGTDRTGIKALQDADIPVAGTLKWGLAFVCRLNGRPSSTEYLPVTGSPAPGYREACFNTPPAAAYWGYWHADGAGSTWTYSNYGASNRNVIPGGFEGWSFSLNKTATTNPLPGVTPTNPAVNASNPTVAVSVDDLDRKINLGTSTTLTWTSTNATSVSAGSVSPATGGGGWSGSLATPGGTKTIIPTALGTYTYIISATGNGVTVYSSATLTVQ